MKSIKTTSLPCFEQLGSDKHSTMMHLHNTINNFELHNGALNTFLSIVILAHTHTHTHRDRETEIERERERERQRDREREGRRKEMFHITMRSTHSWLYGGHQEYGIGPLR